MLLYALSRFVGLGVVHFSWVWCVVLLRGVCLLFGYGVIVSVPCCGFVAIRFRDVDFAHV